MIFSEYFYEHTGFLTGSHVLIFFLIPNLQPYFLFHLLLYPWDFPCPFLAVPQWWHLRFIEESTNDRNLELFFSNTRTLSRESPFCTTDAHKMNWIWSLGSELPLFLFVWVVYTCNLRSTESKIFFWLSCLKYEPSTLIYSLILSLNTKFCYVSGTALSTGWIWQGPYAIRGRCIWKGEESPPGRESSINKSIEARSIQVCQRSASSFVSGELRVREHSVRRTIVGYVP